MKILSRRTFLTVLLLVCLIDMIRAGSVVEDFKDFIHYEEVKKFGKDAAQKTGEVATNAYHSVRDFLSGTTADSTTAATPSTDPPK